MTASILDCALTYRLRGGATGLLPITKEARDFLWRTIPFGDQNGRFVVFDSESRRVAINLDHLIHAQLVIDELLPCPESREPLDAGLQVFLAVSPDPLVFEVDPDTDVLNNYDAEEEDVQLQEFLFRLTLPHLDPRVVHFNVVDEEKVLLLTADVAMVTIPLDALMLTAAHGG